jgi:hypothetical protein
VAKLPSPTAKRVVIPERNPSIRLSGQPLRDSQSCKMYPFRGGILQAQTVSQPSTVAGIYLPALRLDEWIDGYCGRVNLLNHTESRRRLPDLGARLRVARPELPVGAALATIASCIDVPGYQLVLQHTLWPAITILDRDGPKEIAAALQGPGKQIFSKPARREAWFCGKCAAEEASLPPYHSCWHRAHQVPGVFMCEAHGYPLQSVDLERRWTSMPHALTSSEITPLTVVAAELIGRPKARALAKITSVLASHEVEVTTASFKRMVTPSLPPEREVVEALRLLVIQKMDMAWMQFALPAVQTRSLEAALFVERLLVYSEPLSAPALACIALARFGSAAAAITALRRADRRQFT